MPTTFVEALRDVRARTVDLVSPLSAADLERQVDPLMSPLVWDLAHIAAYEDLWLVHRHAGRPLLHGELAARYDAFETPRAVRGEMELLDAAGARGYLADVREPRCRRSTTAASIPWSTRWCCATSSSTPRRCARRWASAACWRPASRLATRWAARTAG
jgi:hypothetical protein